MKRRAYSLWLAALACLALLVSGCGKEVKIVREGDRIIHDYSSKSEKVSSQLTKALLEYGVLDKAAVADGRDDKVLRPSLQEDVYLRWTITSYETETRLADYDSLSQAVSRAARKANARVIEETPEAESAAGPCAIFKLGFSDRSLQGLAMCLETMQVVVLRNLGLAALRASTGAGQYSDTSQPRKSTEAPANDEPSPDAGEQLDLEETAAPAASQRLQDAAPAYRSKEPPLSSADRQVEGALRPRLALIIDDLGSGASATDELMKMDAPLTVAVIPQGRYAAQEAKKAAEQGFAVLLHQPMEPLDPSKRPGKGGIVVDMSEEEIRETICSNLKLVPGAIGVNNHMGSRVTEDAELMRIILDEVFSQGLFFFDSRTSSKSVVAQVAREMGLCVMENARFLDHIASEEYVIDSIRIVARHAIERGSAAAIGHVRPATVRALQKMLPELDSAGVELVTLDALASVAKPAIHRKPEPVEEAIPEPLEEIAPESIEDEVEDELVGEADDEGEGEGEGEDELGNEVEDDMLQDALPEAACSEE